MIKNARTRVLAFLNIVASGMHTGRENDPEEMDAESAARTAQENRDLIVGFKSAHYAGPGWAAIDGAGHRHGACVSMTLGNASDTEDWMPIRTDHVYVRASCDQLSREPRRACPVQPSYD